MTDTLNPRKEITTTAAAMVPTVAAAVGDAWQELDMGDKLGAVLLAVAVADSKTALEGAQPTDVQTAIQDAWRVVLPRVRELVLLADFNQATADQLREIAIVQIRGVKDELDTAGLTPARDTEPDKV
jgi:hypothetical protein